MSEGPTMYEYPGNQPTLTPLPVPPPPRWRQHHRTILVAVTAVAAAVIVAFAAFGVIGGQHAAPITAHGRLELAVSALDGTSTTDYQDIADGGQVTVVNSAGQVIGTGTLTFEQTTNVLMLTADWYKFTVTVPGGLTRYGIQIGQNRGTVWFTASQMKTGPGVCLGDGC